MSTEFDFLDAWLSEENVKNKVSPLSFNDSSQSVDSFNETRIKSEQEEKLRKENLRLRSRVKWYCKALDEQRVRLTQLLTEKLTVREEQRKAVDIEKKLEEAKLCVQATEQLNKQLQELSKTHDIDKSNWKEKVSILEGKVRELKKVINENKHKKDVERKKRRKQLKALMELSEVLIKADLFPKKYKRPYGLWKIELEKNPETKDDDDSFDFEENIEEESAKESSNCEKEVQLLGIEPLKESPSKERGDGALPGVMSGSESSEEETCPTGSSHAAKFFSSLSERVQSNLSKVCQVSSANIRLGAGEDGGRKDFGGKDITSAVSTPCSVSCSVDRPTVMGDVTNHKGSENISNISLTPPCSLSNSEEVKGKTDVEGISVILSEGEDWGWTGDGCSRGSSVMDTSVVKSVKRGKRHVTVKKTKKEKERLSKQCSGDETDLQLILDEMQLKLSLLLPFDDVQSTKPERDFVYHQTENCSSVKSTALGHEGGITEPDKESQTGEDSFVKCAEDDWDVLSHTSSSGAFEEMPLGRESSLRQMSPVAPKYDDCGLKPNKNFNSAQMSPWRYSGLEKKGDSGSTNNFVDAWTSRDQIKKTVEPSETKSIDVLENVIHPNEENEQQTPESAKLLPEKVTNCGGTIISESEVVNEASLFDKKSDFHTYSNSYDCLPDSGFNSPESPIADVEDHPSLFENHLYHPANGTEIIRDSVSLEDSEVTVKEHIVKPSNASDLNSVFDVGLNGLQSSQSLHEGICNEKVTLETNESDVNEIKSLRFKKGKKPRKNKVSGLGKQYHVVNPDDNVNDKGVASKHEQNIRHSKSAEQCKLVESIVNEVDKTVSQLQNGTVGSSIRKTYNARCNKSLSRKGISCLTEKELVNDPKCHKPKNLKGITSDDEINRSRKLLQLSDNDKIVLESSNSEVEKSGGTGNCPSQERCEDSLLQEDCVGNIQIGSKTTDNDNIESEMHFDDTSSKAVELLQTSDSRHHSESVNKSDDPLLNSQGCELVNLNYNSQINAEKGVMSVLDSTTNSDMLSNSSFCENTSQKSEDTIPFPPTKDVTLMSTCDRADKEKNSSIDFDLDRGLDKSSFHASKDSNTDSSSLDLGSVSSPEKAASNLSQPLICAEKERNVDCVSEIPPSFEKWNSLLEQSCTTKQARNPMMESKMFGFASTPMPSFNELNSRSPTPISKCAKPQGDYFHSLSSGWNSSKVCLNKSDKSHVFPTGNEANGNSISLGSIGMLNRTKHVSISTQKLNSISANCQVDVEYKKEVLENSFRMSELLCVEKVNSGIHWPLSAKHLSFLKKPYGSPLAHLIEEEDVKPKSAILVRCKYKSAIQRSFETSTHESSFTDNIQDMLMTSLTLHDNPDKHLSGLSTDKFQLQSDLKSPMSGTNIPIKALPENMKSQLGAKPFIFKGSTTFRTEGNDAVVTKENRKASSAMKCKRKSSLPKRVVVPFFFGKCNPHFFYRVKFRILGHFASESFIDAYAAPGCSVVNFGHGDFKDMFMSSEAEQLSSNIPTAKFLGVKCFRYGRFAPASYADRYSNPEQPVINTIHRKSKMISSSSDENALLNPACNRKQVTEETSADMAAGNNKVLVNKDKAFSKPGVLSEPTNVPNSIRHTNGNSVGGVHAALPAFRVESLGPSPPPHRTNDNISPTEKSASLPCHSPAQVSERVTEEIIGDSVADDSSVISTLSSATDSASRGKDVRKPQGFDHEVPSLSGIESLAVLRRNDSDGVIASFLTHGKSTRCEGVPKGESVSRDDVSVHPIAIKQHSLPQIIDKKRRIKAKDYGTKPLKHNVDEIQHSDLITDLVLKEKPLGAESNHAHDGNLSENNTKLSSENSCGSIPAVSRSSTDGHIALTKESERTNEENQPSNFDKLCLSGEDDAKSTEDGIDVPLERLNDVKNKSNVQPVCKVSQDAHGIVLKDEDSVAADETEQFDELNASFVDHRNDSSGTEKNVEVQDEALESSEVNGGSNVDLPMTGCASSLVNSNPSGENHESCETDAAVGNLFGSDSSLDARAITGVAQISKKLFKRKVRARVIDSSASDEEPLKSSTTVENLFGSDSSLDTRDTRTVTGVRRASKRLLKRKVKARVIDSSESDDEPLAKIKCMGSSKDVPLTPDSSKDSICLLKKSTTAGGKMLYSNLNKTPSNVGYVSIELGQKNCGEEGKSILRSSPTHDDDINGSIVAEHPQKGKKTDIGCSVSVEKKSGSSVEILSQKGSNQASLNKCSQGHQISPVASKVENGRRRPRKQSLSRCIKDQEDELDWIGDSHKIMQMAIFGEEENEISEEDESLTESNDIQVTLDFKTLTGNLAESVDDIYQNPPKKRRIAHTPKTIIVIGGRVSSSPEKDNMCVPDTPLVSKPVPKKVPSSSLIKSSVCQKSKVKQSKLEKLRNKLAKAKGTFCVSKAECRKVTSLNKEVIVSNVELHQPAKEEKVITQKSTSPIKDSHSVDEKVQKLKNSASVQKANKNVIKKLILEEETTLKSGKQPLNNDRSPFKADQKSTRKLSDRKLEVVKPGSLGSCETADKEDSLTKELEELSPDQGLRGEIIQEKVMETPSELTDKSSTKELNLSDLSLEMRDCKEEFSPESSADCVMSTPAEKKAVGCESNSNATCLNPEKLLESMEVPPLSPLSADELVDSFILCTDADHENWSPMLAAKERNTLADDAKIVHNGREKIASTEGDADSMTHDERSSKALSLNVGEAPKDVSVKLEEKGPSTTAQAAYEQTASEKEGIKEFFYDLMLVHRGKAVPKDQKNSETVDKKILKNLLGRLKRKYFRTEDLNFLVASLSDEFEGFETKPVAKYIVRMLSKEDEDDVDHPFTGFAPRLSDMQLRILSLILALDRRCPRFKDLIDVILLGISYKLFRLGYAPQVEVIMTLARMYSVLCKSRKDLQMARTFCYDALFCLGTKAYSLVFVVLSVWPEVFRIQDKNQGADHIENSILLAIADKRLSRKSSEPKVSTVKNLIVKVYKSEHHKAKPEDFLKNLVSTLREGTKLQGIEAAMILLAKKQGWDWTHSNLLCGNLVSVMEDWMKGTHPLRSAVLAVKLIGFTSRSCSMETPGPIRAIADVLSEALCTRNVYPMEIQEALARSLICLSRYLAHRVIHALDDWVPTSTPSYELVNLLIRFIQRTNKDYWSKTFRCWRRRATKPKNVLTPFRQGTYFTEGKPEEYWGRWKKRRGGKGGGGGGEVGEDGEEEKDCEGGGGGDWGEGGEGERGMEKVGGRTRRGCAMRGGAGLKTRGGWRGKGGPLNSRWIKFQSEGEWIKKEEEAWNNIAWAKTAKLSQPQKRENEIPTTYFDESGSFLK